jgi:pyruvate/2-oxoglutarate/acetoin dehydrogenase E1 component
MLNEFGRIDILVNNAAKVRFMFGGKASCPIVVRIATSGGIRRAYHHSQSIEPWLMNVPIAFTPPMEDYVMPTVDRIIAACREAFAF